MEKLVKILLKPQVLVVLSLATLFFSFGIVGNIIGGGEGSGCGGGGDQEAGSDSEYSASSGIGSGKFFTGATGKFTEDMLATLHPDAKAIAMGSQFIERTSLSDAMIDNKYFHVVHFNPLMREPELLATPLHVEGESIASKYGVRFIVPKADGVNMALPKHIIFIPPLTPEDQKKPIAYVGSKENYPNCEAIKFSELKSKYITMAAYDTALAEIKEKIKNPKTPSCSLELAIRSYCDGKGGAQVRVLQGIHYEEPWNNTKEVINDYGNYDDKNLYSVMYLQKACDGMVITNDNNQNAEIRFSGIDISKNTPEGTATDKGKNDGNWYLADPELNVYVSKWSSNNSAVGSASAPTLEIDGKPMVYGGTVVDDEHDPVKREGAPLVVVNLDSRTKPDNLMGYNDIHFANFKESTGPLYWYLRTTSKDMVQYFHEVKYLPCKTSWGCQTAGGNLWDGDGDPRLKDGKKCDYDDFYPYEIEKYANGAPVYGVDGNDCQVVHKKASGGGLTLKQDFYQKIDEIADKFLANPNLLINYRHITRIFTDTILRKKFCEGIYGENTCKYGGVLLLKLPANDKPANHKITISHPTFKEFTENSLITKAKLLIRGVRFNLNISAGTETVESATNPNEYAIKLDGVELVSKEFVINTDKMIIDNSYFLKSYLHIDNPTPGSRVLNTLFNGAVGKTIGSNGTWPATEKKYSDKPWEETFVDRANAGYFSFMLNTNYRGGGINSGANNWLIDDNAWVNGGQQECVIDASTGLKNARIHQNWCDKSGAGNAIPMANAEDVDIIDNQFIRFNNEGDGLSTNKLSWYYDKFIGGGGVLGIGKGSKNIRVENNLIGRSSPESSIALSVAPGDNIMVKYNTIAGGNLAPYEKSFEISPAWQWVTSESKYRYFTNPNATDSWTIKSPAKYTITAGAKLQGSRLGISVGFDTKAMNENPNAKVTLEGNLAVGSITDELTSWYHPNGRGDYAESMDNDATKAMDSKFISLVKNYFEICGAVNHQPSNIVGNETTFLSLKLLEEKTGVPDQVFYSIHRTADKCNSETYKNDLQYFYTIDTPPLFKDPQKNDFHITNKAANSGTSENKYTHIGFNYWDERTDYYALSNPVAVNNHFKAIEFGDLINIRANGYPKGNLDGNYPSYFKPSKASKDMDLGESRYKSDFDQRDFEKSEQREKREFYQERAPADINRNVPEEVPTNSWIRKPDIKERTQSYEKDFELSEKKPTNPKAKGKTIGKQKEKQKPAGGNKTKSKMKR